MKEVNPIALRIGYPFFWNINYLPVNSIITNYNVYLNQTVVNLVHDLLIEHFKMALFYLKIYTNTLDLTKNIVFIFYQTYLCYKKFIKKKYIIYYRRFIKKKYILKKFTITYHQRKKYNKYFSNSIQQIKYKCKYYNTLNKLYYIYYYKNKKNIWEKNIYNSTIFIVHKKNKNRKKYIKLFKPKKIKKYSKHHIFKIRKYIKLGFKQNQNKVNKHIKKKIINSSNQIIKVVKNNIIRNYFNYVKIHKLYRIKKIFYKKNKHKKFFIKKRTYKLKTINRFTSTLKQYPIHLFIKKNTYRKKNINLYFFKCYTQQIIKSFKSIIFINQKSKIKKNRRQKKILILLFQKHVNNIIKHRNRYKILRNKYNCYSTINYNTSIYYKSTRLCYKLTKYKICKYKIKKSIKYYLNTTIKIKFIYFIKRNLRLQYNKKKNLIKKINSKHIKYKLLSKYTFENILSSVLENKKINIFYKNHCKFFLINKPLLFSVYRVYNNLFYLHRNKYFIDLVNIIGFNIHFKKHSLESLVQFIQRELHRTKKHRQFLNSLILVFKEFIKDNKDILGGFKLIILGPIGKHGRTKFFKFETHDMPLQTFNKIIYYNIASCTTKFGTLGIRLWVH